MNESFLLRVFLAASIWIVEATLVFAGAWLLTWVFRKNASLRHLTWLTAFCAALLIPCLTAFVPALFMFRTSAPIRVGDYLRSSAPQKWALTAKGQTLLAKDKRMVVLPDAPPAHPLSAQTTAVRRCGPSVRFFLLWLWLGGVVLGAIRGVGAVYGIRVLRRLSEESPFDTLSLAKLAGWIGLTRAWELRISAAATPPVAMTWGTWRPVVLLPQDAVCWPKERLEAVLLHELAHIQRYDSLSQGLAFVVCALYWFHPAVWLAARAMRAEAEVATDDAVLLSGVKPSDYAAQLLWFAAHLGQKRQPFAVMGVSLMKQSKIETRILSIVDSSRRRRLLTFLEALRASVIGLIAAMLLASVRPALSSATAPRDSLASLKPAPLLSSLRQTLRPLLALAPPTLHRGYRRATKLSPARAKRRVRQVASPAPVNPPEPTVPSSDVISDMLLTNVWIKPPNDGWTKPHKGAWSKPHSADTIQKREVAFAPDAARTNPARSADAAPVLPQTIGNDPINRSGDAESDRRRNKGNAHGKGETDEAMAKRGEAAVRKAIPDVTAADRFISEADRIDALWRQKQR